MVINTLDELGFFYDGAGIDICDINKNGTPDLLMMVYDPQKEKIHFDIKLLSTYNQMATI